MAKYLCFDIGGTNIKYAIAEKDGTIIKEGKYKNPVRDYGAEKMLLSLIEKGREINSLYNVEGVAIATAGVVDAEEGKIIYARDNFPAYTGMELKRIITKELNLFCTVENDVNCAALGEFWLGAGKGVASIVCITAGTGVGGAICFDGKIHHGSASTAAEIGYMNVNGGNLEELGSTTFLVRETAKLLNLKEDEVDGELVFSLARSGEKRVKAIIRKQVESLSIAMANIAFLINPEIIILGGGIMEEREYLLPLFDEELKKQLSVLPVLKKSFRYEFAQLGNRAGMLGALYNFLQKTTF